MFDNLDRYLIAGLGLLCGGLILLRKKPMEELEVMTLETESEVADNRPNAIIIPFPFHMRPLYDALPGFNPNEDAEIIHLSVWKMEHLQQVQVRQMNG